MFPKRIVSWFSILLLAVSLAPAGQHAAAIPQMQTTPPPGSVVARLNEVMPKPEAGSPAWVELYVGVSGETVYLPVIRRGTTGLTSLGLALQAATLDLKGWQVSNESGQAYTLPANLPPLPAGIFILILFDGSGPAGNDVDPSDGMVVLHTPQGLLDIFPDEAGQAALHRPGSPGPATMVDFVAWGGFSASGAASAVEAGLWGMGEAVSFENGFGDIDDADILARNESIGRFPGSNAQGALNWANYPVASLTPGAANPVQPVLFITPENGAQVDAATLSLSWRQSAGADGYRFQLDNNSDFSSPLIDQTIPKTYLKPTPNLAAGMYFWRINPLRAGQPAGWTPAFLIQVVNLLAPDEVSGGNRSDAVTAEVVLGIARISQNKDSRLLGLDGAPEGDPTTNLPEDAWDAAAPCTEPPCADPTKYMHGNMYCVRASIRMVSSYYHALAGEKLSMDRISYYVLDEWTGNTRPGSNDATPDNDLGYNRGMYYPDEEDQAFSWALNFTYATPGGKPSFATVKAAIDAQQPVMFRRPGHMMVIDGYRETSEGGQYLHVLDPDQPPDFERWQNYSTQNIDGYWIGPAGGPDTGIAHTDESSMWADSDGDGIMDFDEVQRFDLDPFDPDSDGDWVLDKQDMREYVFNSGGAYSFRSSDSDSDGLRKELDPDNDGDGSPDSCEDTNRNGKYEVGLSETDNFSNASHQACVPVFDILHPTTLEPVNAGDVGAPQKILVQVGTAVPVGWPLVLTAGDFSASIGGRTASVLAAYPSADTTFLVVAPPTQTSSAHYDLRVTLSSIASDTEEDAVLYEPKAPNDEVIVLDRSGSMLANNKIGAAQNAASAFVDFLSDGDWTGVTSFATSASTDYTLHEITPGSSVREDAIAAIQALSATGSTALGQGMQLGQDMLASAGHKENDWTLVLLSDGWENVPPYWDTVAPKIEKSTIHTVALGSDADTVLLQQIAADFNGTYFYVDVNPSVLPALVGPAPSVAPALPNTLPNRLADTYLAIGELEHGWQRLFEQSMPSMKQDFLVDVPKGLPEAVFALNWSTPSGLAEIQQILDPKGEPVKPDAVLSNFTHQQWHLLNPEGGTYHVFINILKQVDGMELFFTLSGRSETTLIAGVGGDPSARGVGSDVPIYGILTDRRPIAGASVQALVTGGGGSAFLQLYDDGRHGDGKEDDGLYANMLKNVDASGGYSVKLVGSGTNNSGDAFVRYASTGFNVRPRLAYIWKDRLDTALDYVALLEQQHWIVDLLPLTSVTTARLQPCELIIVGPDTGYTSNWGTPPALNAILESQKPVLGLGEGGYAFFGKLKLAIGYPFGVHGQGDSIVWSYGSDSIWSMPFDIPLEKEPLQLYAKPTSSVDIHVDQVPGGVIIFGYTENSPLYADLLQQNGRYMFWGFEGGPRLMTVTGRRLFINAVFRNIP